MPVNSQPSSESEPCQPSSGKGRLFVRSRNISVLLFAIIFCLMVAVMMAAFDNVAGKISNEYAEGYAVSSAEALSARIAGDIGLMSKAAHSGAITEWLADEYNEDKRTLAYNEMTGIIGELYSFNLYVGVNKSLNEYKIDINDAAGSGKPFDVLDKTQPPDAWYFACAKSENEYLISVNIDHVMKRKRVWLDYKVAQDNAVLGVISTGLEFSHIVGELFSHNNNMRSLIVDSHGMIHMDSYLTGDKRFLYNEFENSFDDEFSDPVLQDAVKAYFKGMNDKAVNINKPAGIKLSNGPYRYIAIAPVRFAGWAVVILAGNTTGLLDMSLFLPVAVVVFALLIAFALLSGVVNYHLIFRPLGKLDSSLALIKENNGGQIYGTGRDDELGHLAHTIQYLFTKANVDELTGIYNRRFMENGLEHLMGMMGRSGGMLSVLMLDVDYFKKYNDTYGHDQGDLCLKAVAQSLNATLKRGGDFAARYGGEEFVAVLPDTDEAGARLVAEALLENVRSLNIPHANNAAAPYVTVSAGVATGRVEYGQNWVDYIKRADTALYMSKQSGRNRYTYLDFFGKH